MSDKEGAVRVPRDRIARELLYRAAGLTDEEEQAVEAWVVQNASLTWDEVRESMVRASETAKRLRAVLDAEGTP